MNLKILPLLLIFSFLELKTVANEEYRGVGSLTYFDCLELIEFEIDRLKSKGQELPSQSAIAKQILDCMNGGIR